MNQFLAFVQPSLGVRTIVAGFFGMTLISGFEDSPTALKHFNLPDICYRCHSVASVYCPLKMANLAK